MKTCHLCHTGARAGKRRSRTSIGESPRGDSRRRLVRLHDARRRAPATVESVHAGSSRDTVATTRRCRVNVRSLHPRSSPRYSQRGRSHPDDRARLRTRFRPLHGNFNPIRNIFRTAGQAASGKRGTTAREEGGEGEQLSHSGTGRNCAKRRMLRVVSAALRGGCTCDSRPIARSATASRGIVTRRFRAVPWVHHVTSRRERRNARRWEVRFRLSPPLRWGAMTRG